MPADWDFLILGLSIFISLGWCVYVAIHFLALMYGKCKLHRKVDGLDSENAVFPPVSILKPLTGSDSNLASNLETFFTLNYPQYELLFCLESDCDPALLIVKSLMSKYSQIDAHIFIGGEQVGANPKINNMMPGYRSAKYELLMISDSSMRMKEDTLMDMVNSMTYKVGIVTQMPFTCDRKGFAANVEKIYFGTAHARIYLGADLLSIICSTGMSSMMRKKVLDELGGMSAFSQYLAEDYYFASAIASKGWKCAISSQPGWQNSGNCQLALFHARLERWAKLRMTLVPLTSMLEPFQECFLLGCIAAWAVNFLFRWNPIIFLTVHVLAWIISDYTLLCIVQNGPLPFGKVDFLVGWLYRECSALPNYLRALCSNKVRWRSRTYILKWGGECEELKPQKPGKYSLLDV